MCCSAALLQSPAGVRRPRLQATYFDQKFHATFFLAAEEASAGSGGGVARATQAAALLRRLGPPRAPLAQLPTPLDPNQGSQPHGTSQEGERGRAQLGPVPHPRTGPPAATGQRSGESGRMQMPGVASSEGAVELSDRGAAEGRRGGDAAPASASVPSGGSRAGADAAGADFGEEGASGEPHAGSVLRASNDLPDGASHAGADAAAGRARAPDQGTGSGGARSSDRGSAHAEGPMQGASAVEDAAAAHRRLRETVHRQAAVMR